MQKKLFGTDGIRGVWQEISPELAYQIGKAVAKVFYRENETNLIVVGKDTRLSSDSLLSALCAGITAVGTNVVVLDVVPTACVPFSIKYHKAVAGVMITASHNPAKYNGFKFFNGNGFKISNEQESLIEYLIENNYDISLCKFDSVGQIYNTRKSVKEYVNFLKKELKPCKKFKICFDTCNGCATEIVKDVFKHYDVKIFNSNPDGLNVNLACGANHSESLKSYMQSNSFDFGFAFDGDADRVCVAMGDKILSGEEVIYYLSKFYQGEKIVTTQMTNMALIQLLESEKTTCEITSVGEKELMECLLKENLKFGAENNGHYTFLDKCTTSDGILACVRLLSLFAENKNINCKYKPYYQVNKNICTINKEFVINSDVLKNKIYVCESLLLDSGRILVRASGTENLIRILVEGADKNLVDEIANELEKTIIFINN